MSKKTLFYTLNGSLRCLSAPPPLPSPRLSPPLAPVPGDSIACPTHQAQVKKKI